MLLPNSEKAVVDIRKLTDYLLDPQHRDGKHKARLFFGALRLSREKWQGRRAIIRSGWIIEHGADIPRLTTAYPV